MKFLLFHLLFLTAAHQNHCESTIDVVKAYKEQNFKKILELNDKFPALFSEPREMVMLARAYFSLKQNPHAVYTCALSMDIQRTNACNNILKLIQTSNVEDFDYGVAMYYFEKQDFENAFIKYSKLLAEHPKNEDYRIWLVKTLFRLGYVDYAQEQLWELPPHNSTAQTLQRNFDIKRKNLERYIRNSKMLTPDKEEIYYQFLFLTQTADPEILKFLLTLYNSKIEERFSEKFILRITNLHLLNKEFKKVEEMLREIGPKIVRPMHILSYQSLKKRLDLERRKHRLAMKELELQDELRKTGKDVLTAEKLSKPLELTEQNDPIPPLDIGDVKFANPGNFTAFNNIHAQFADALSSKPSMFQKRWLFHQLDQAENLILESQEAQDALDAYAKTPEGREFEEQVDALHEEILAEDQKNAVKFNGELNRFQRNMSIAKTKDQKLQILKNYIAKWDQIANGSEADLESQGAFIAYGDTEEGKKLKKEVYELVKEFNIIPPSMTIDPEFLNEVEGD
jgi:hypothetical protein